MHLHMILQIKKIKEQRENVNLRLLRLFGLLRLSRVIGLGRGVVVVTSLAV